jgi:leucyl/phenylalanyl-tRNA--protein transferase
MADPSDGSISWYSPDPRAIIPLDQFRVSRSLRRVVTRRDFEVLHDTAFSEVIRSCADRPETWISADVMAVYADLHRRGVAHSVETWKGGRLVGGLYGLAIGGAFFGESMFSTVSDASKVALVHLVNHLSAQGFLLLDAQFSTPHLASFGTVEVSREEYLRMLATALAADVKF